MTADLPPERIPEPALRVAATEAVAKAEAAATRRRWINLGEFVAVAGLVIGGVGLWLNWSDRRADVADKQAERTAEVRQAARYEIAATVGKNDTLEFARDERHPLGDITLAFPAALGLEPLTTPTQSVAKAGYEHALLKGTDGGADTQTGTLPVLVTVQYWDGDTQRAAHGIYDIVWHTEGRRVFGRALHIVGFKRRERGGTQARVDALWTAERAALAH